MRDPIPTRLLKIVYVDSSRFDDVLSTARDKVADPDYEGPWLEVWWLLDGAEQIGWSEEAIDPVEANGPD